MLRPLQAFLPDGTSTLVAAHHAVGIEWYMQVSTLHPLEKEEEAHAGGVQHHPPLWRWPA